MLTVTFGISGAGYRASTKPALAGIPIPPTPAESGDQRGAVSISAGVPNRGKERSGMEDQSRSVIMLAAGGHHHQQSFAVGYPDQGSCLVAAERLRRNKKAHIECLKFVQGK